MKNKSGFTLPELLIVLTIAGILIVISLYTVNNRFTDFFTRYYAAYDALNKAVYNTYTDTYCRVDAVGSPDCVVGNDSFSSASKKNKNEGRPFPTTTKQLCNRLKEYLNAVDGEGKCGAASVTDPRNIYVNGSDKPYLQFALSNGFRIYFSNIYKNADFPHGETQKKYNFFIVYVDLNGKQGPNRFTLPHPDIVPFIITFKGDVIPVGLPTLDKTYATARVVTSDGTETKSFTIDEAVQIAFGSEKVNFGEDDPRTCMAYMYTDIPITLMRDFHDKALYKSMLIPHGAPRIPHHKLGNDRDNTDKNHLGCACGTFNCMLKIDENLERRH